MKTRSVVLFFVLPAVVLALAIPARAGDSLGQLNIGFAQHFTNKPCRALEIPTFEALVPIPNIIDPFEFDNLSFSCFVGADRKEKGVKNVKGTFESELILIDNLTGVTERIPVGSGRFKTDSNGRDSFDFEIPSELFADGFESGDVSAWSYTRSDFTNKKRVDNSAVQCGKNASKRK